MVIRVAPGVALRLWQPRPGGRIWAQLEDGEAPAGMKVRASRKLNGRQLAEALFDRETIVGVHDGQRERDLFGRRD